LAQEMFELQQLKKRAGKIRASSFEDTDEDWYYLENEEDWKKYEGMLREYEGRANYAEILVVPPSYPCFVIKGQMDYWDSMSKDNNGSMWLHFLEVKTPIYVPDFEQAKCAYCMGSGGSGLNAICHTCGGSGEMSRRKP